MARNKDEDQQKLFDQQQGASTQTDNTPEQTETPGQTETPDQTEGVTPETTGQTNETATGEETPVGADGSDGGEETNVGAEKSDEGEGQPMVVGSTSQTVSTQRSTTTTTPTPEPEKSQEELDAEEAARKDENYNRAVKDVNAGNLNIEDINDLYESGDITREQYQRLAYAVDPNLDPDVQERQARRARNNALISAIGDGVSAMANLYYTSRGAPGSKQTPALSDAARERYDEVMKRRQASMNSYATALQNARALRLGREKEDRARQYDWEKTQEQNRYNMQVLNAKTAAERQAALDRYQAEQDAMDKKYASEKDLQELKNRGALQVAWTNARSRENVQRLKNGNIRIPVTDTVKGEEGYVTIDPKSLVQQQTIGEIIAGVRDGIERGYYDDDDDVKNEINRILNKGAEITENELEYLLRYASQSPQVVSVLKKISSDTDMNPIPDYQPPGAQTATDILSMKNVNNADNYY